MGCAFCCCRPQEVRQTGLLVKKQLRLLWRSKWTTAIQVFAPLAFTIILVVLEVSLRNQVAQDGRVVTSFPVEGIPKIPACVPSVITSERCITVAYAPEDPTLRAIIQEILTEAGINESPVGFTSAAALDTFLANNKNRTQAAYIFNTPTAPFPTNFQGLVFDYTIQYNSTQFCRGFKCNNPQAEIVAPMQYAMDKKIWDRNFGANKLTVNSREFPRLELFTVDVVKEYGIFFYFLTYMFIFIVGTGNIVMEKESQLREYMRLAGLRNCPFWLSWFVQQFLLVLAATLVLVTSGAACQFNFFLKNNFGTYFFLFLLFGISITATSFMISTLVQKSRVATPLGFVIFIVFYFVASIAGDIYPIVSEGIRQIFAFFPPILFSKGLTDLGNASAGDLDSGLRFSDINSYTDIWPLSKIYGWLIIDALLFSVLTWYFDHAVPGPNGVSKGCCFCFTPSYLCGRPCRRKNTSPREVERKWLPTTEHLPLEDPSVKEHRLMLLRQEGLLGTTGATVPVEEGSLQGAAPEAAPDSVPSEDYAIRIMNLVKQYGRKRSTVAVRRLYLGIPKNMLFCLLGPNGAGKTTTISMLTGLLPLTSGLAEIHGMSVYNDLENVHKIIGVCPQFDLLWPQLTAYEHLELFSGIRDIPKDKMEEEIRTRLEEVSLWDVKDNPSSSFSGGMKRRLSVAISLIGDPKVVFLDEPTTGMDPVMRRQVWDMIENAKKGRTIVLTTHSMEEADILGDKIAIVAKGRLRALGTSLQLKNRFGTGYQLRVSASPDKLGAVADFVAQLLPDARLASNMGGFLTFNVPRNLTPQLPDVFRALKARSQELTLRNFGVQLSTLEDVFLEIVERAKKEEDEINGKKGGKKKRKKTGDGQGDEDSGVEMQPVRTRSPVDPERVEFSSPSPPVENGGRALSHNEVRTALPLHPSKDQE